MPQPRRYRQPRNPPRPLNGFYPKRPSIPHFAPGSGRGGWLLGSPYVMVQSWNEPLSVTALLDDEGGKEEVTGSEWQTIERPGNIGLTERSHRRNKELALNIIVEGWVTRPGGGLHIEGMLATLEGFADAGTTVRVIGAVPYWGRRWAITDISYAETIRDRVTGKRMRQHMTLNLLEYVEAAGLLGLSKPEGATTRIYRIARGDDLQKIAAKRLGKASRWREIVALNEGMRAVKLTASLFPVGTRIRIPAK